MNSHESTEQAPIVNEGNIEPTNLQIGKKLRLQILGIQMLPVGASYYPRIMITCQMNPGILWAH